MRVVNRGRRQMGRASGSFATARLRAPGGALGSVPRSTLSLKNAGALALPHGRCSGPSALPHDNSHENSSFPNVRSDHAVNVE